MPELYDVAVLGAGPGGYVAALRAAQLGARTVLVERDRVGGTCLNVGCIPTKALTTASELLVRTQQAAAVGLRVEGAEVDLAGLMAYKDDAVSGLVSGVEHLLREGRVVLLRGDGRVVGPGRLHVSAADGHTTIVESRCTVLAPGSVTARPPIPGLDLPGVVTSTEALEIERVPEHMVVVGGGAIGLEFACVYEALGSRVTILEMMPTLLPGGTDEAIAGRLAAVLRRRGLVVHLGAAVQGIDRAPAGVRVTFASAGAAGFVEADRVLVAVGRVPNTSDGSLADLELDMRGAAIAVDARMATSVPGVWAIGDAVGGWMLAHKAMVEGRAVAENVTGGDRSVDYRSVPNVVWSRPEVASVGLTEAQALAAGAPVATSQFPFSANPRARILGERVGLVKLVCEADSGRVLGVHMMGPQVTELIAEGALAVQLGAGVDDLAWTTHAHPTLPEAVLEAALGFRNAAIHFRRG